MAEHDGGRPAEIALMLVDDQALVRAGFRMVLEATPGFRVLAEAGDGQETLRMVTGALEEGGEVPDVILMDIRMPVMDGVEATRRIRALGEDAPKVLVLTTFDLDEYVYAALQAGASGFLLKDARPSDLLGAIESVVAGDAVIAPSATRRLLEQFLPGEGRAVRTPGAGAVPDHPRLAPLTEREREILQAVGRGLTNAEICSEFFVAEATVKTHIGRILHKLGLRDRVQMVILAYEVGLVG